MSNEYVLALAKGITVATESAEQIVIHVPLTYKRHTYKGLSPGLRQAFELLASTGANENELACRVEEEDGPVMLARLYYYLFLFAEQRLLSYSVVSNGRRVATLDPISAYFSFSPAPINPRASYTLSRFAYLHRESGTRLIPCRP